MRITSRNLGAFLSGIVLVTLAVGMAVVLPHAAQAGILAYDVPFGTAVGQGHTGPLGEDFIVNVPIRVTALGVYDQASDGIVSATITAQLWSRNDNGTPGTPGDDTGIAILASDTFTHASPGTLAPGSGYSLKPLASPILLSPGAYTMAATNFGSAANDRNANTFSNTPFGTANNGGGALSFVGLSRWSASGLGFPTNLDSHPYKYGAGTFEYEIGPIEVAGDGVIGADSLAAERRNVVNGPPPLPNAKTIILRQNWNDYFHFAEVRAFDTGGVNQALQSQGGSASATSSGWGSEPGDANDGNTDGNFGNGSVWHTADWERRGATLTITLANPTTLGSVDLWGRTDCCAERHNDFDLIIKDAGGLVLLSQNVLGMGGDPGIHRSIPVGAIVSGEEVGTLFPGLTYAFEIDGDTLQSDQLVVPSSMPGVLTTVLDINGARLMVELAGGALDYGDTFDLLAADRIDGTFASLDLPYGAGHWDTSKLYTTGEIRFIPEPVTLGLVLLGGAGVCGYVRRRRARRAA